MPSSNCQLFYFLIPIITLSTLFLLVFIYEQIKFNISYFDYTINEKSFKVLKDKENFNNAAEILYQIDNNIIKLINYITKKYQNNDDNIDTNKYKIIKSIILKTQQNYKSHSLIESFPKNPGKDVSFNINKGDSISLCLRDFANPSSFHEFNDIIFVAIHELAHSCTISYQHTDEFWYNFRFLLENAIEAKLYVNKDYNKYPVNYCSMEITYNPIFDPEFDDEIYLAKK